MSILTIGLLKQIIDNLPDDYEIEYQNDNTIVLLEDRVEIDITAKTLTLKWALTDSFKKSGQHY